MTDLAENNQSGDFVSLAEVARRQKLSRGFLEEVVAPLKGAGLVNSRRGAYGGYRLAKATKQISIADIVLAVEGSLALVECLGQFGCPTAKCCSTKSVWSRVQDKIVEALSTITLADVIGKNFS
jgi:Rrf2 family protein